MGDSIVASLDAGKTLPESLRHAIDAGHGPSISGASVRINPDEGRWQRAHSGRRLTTREPLLVLDRHDEIHGQRGFWAYFGRGSIDLIPRHTVPDWAR